jgi:adenylate cyclase
VPRVVFVIADLAGYTALTEARGGDRAATTVARYRDVAERALADGARIVEQIGDQLLIVAGDARAAMISAIRIRIAVDNEPWFPGVRVGIADGDVVERAGRYFGAALNLTGRLAARANTDEILCTAAVAEACRDLEGIEFRGLGMLRFKNVPTPVDVCAVVSGRANGRVTVVDPVCRMHLEPEAALARLPFGDATHHFCSLDCARAFAMSPESYVTSAAF